MVINLHHLTRIMSYIQSYKNSNPRLCVNDTGRYQILSAHVDPDGSRTVLNDGYQGTFRQAVDAALQQPLFYIHETQPGSECNDDPTSPVNGLVKRVEA